MHDVESQSLYVHSRVSKIRKNEEGMLIRKQRVPHFVSLDIHFRL